MKSRIIAVAILATAFHSFAVANETYRFDQARSTIGFSVHQFLGTTHGKFKKFDGRIEIDREHPENSAVTARIDVRSIDTETVKRDNHLRSAEFFNVDKYPELTFKSRSVKQSGSQFGDIVGDLTMHGVAKEITLPVTHLGAGKDPWGRDKIGFETEIALNRKDFGLAWNTALEAGGFLIGDEVKVSVTIQGVGQ